MHAGASKHFYLKQFFLPKYRQRMNYYIDNKVDPAAETAIKKCKYYTFLKHWRKR